MFSRGDWSFDVRGFVCFLLAVVWLPTLLGALGYLAMYFRGS